MIHETFRAMALTLAGLSVLLPATAGAQLGFGPPAALSTDAPVSTGSVDSGPLVTDGNGTWIAFWDVELGLNGALGSDFDIVWARSVDNGATWSAPAPIDSGMSSDSTDEYIESVTSLATDGGGVWVFVWEVSTASGDSDLLFARSTDDGLSWGAATTLNSNAATDAGDDTHPSVDYGGNGVWITAWESTDDLDGTIGTDFDILYVRSTDNGATWSDPMPLNPTAASDSAEGDFGVRTASDGGGNWVAAFQSTNDLDGSIGADRDVLVSTSSDNGLTWSSLSVLEAGMAADGSSSDSVQFVETDGSGAWLVVSGSDNDLGGTVGTDIDLFAYSSTDNGASWVGPTVVNSSAATDISGDTDKDCTLTTDREGTWLALWYTSRSGPDPVRAARSFDLGASWSDLEELGSPDTFNYAPAAETDGAGTWMVMWSSDDDLDGTIGSDDDVLVAVSTTVDSLFADGFESGDTNAWSVTVP